MPTESTHHTDHPPVVDGVFCAGCGANMHREAHTCPKCGLPSYGHHKSQVTAGLLAIFLGTLGIHKFYLGKWVQGILHIVFTIFLFWTFLPMIVPFIEGIIYLTANPKKWRYISGA